MYNGDWFALGTPPAKIHEAMITVRQELCAEVLETQMQKEVVANLSNVHRSVGFEIFQHDAELRKAHDRKGCVYGSSRSLKLGDDVRQREVQKRRLD